MRGFANRALRCFLNPLRYALLVIGMLALQLDQFLISLEFAIANRANILLSLLLARIVALIL